MKQLALLIFAFATSAHAADFPSSKIKREGIPGSLEQRAQTKLDCAKKISHVALKHMQIQGLKPTEVKGQDGFSGWFLKDHGTGGREYEMKFKDESTGTEFKGAMHMVFRPVKDGIACKPNRIDVFDNHAGNLYRWKSEGGSKSEGNEVGSVSYLEFPDQAPSNGVAPVQSATSGQPAAR